MPDEKNVDKKSAVVSGVALAMAKRFGRAFAAVAVPIAIQWLTENKNPYIMLITPALLALGKGLRDQFGWDWLPI